MGRFKLWIIIGGIALAFYGFQEWRLSGEAKSEAQEISCAALGADGYGKNAHVKLNDFLLSPAGFVYEEKRGNWEKVWIPVVPLGGAYDKLIQALPEGAEFPAPKKFSVILQTSHAKNQTQLINIAQQDIIQGVVINEIDSLDSETKKLLRESYPGIDLDTCWIIEHKRTTTSAMLSMVLLALGLAVLGFGISLLFRGNKKRD